MINSWTVATIVAIVAGSAGFFVVLRGSTFAAHALPLGTFPGAAAAALIGVNELWGLIVFSGLGVIGISGLGRHQRNDVATALTLIALLGLGTLFLSLSTEYSEAVYALLFGEVLGIGTGEIVPVVAVSIVAVAILVVFFHPLLLSSISPELSRARGVSADRMNVVFLSILALATAMALPVVGALLVFSLMVGPASAARAFTTRPAVAVFLSIAIALVTVWLAIAISYITNWPIGFFVGVFAAISYGAARCWNASRKRWPAGRQSRSGLA